MNRAFTLIELLVVIAIIGVLAALLFPVLSEAKRSGERSADHNALRQLATAAALYHETYEVPKGGDPTLWVGVGSCSDLVTAGHVPAITCKALRDPYPEGIVNVYERRRPFRSLPSVPTSFFGRRDFFHNLYLTRSLKWKAAMEAHCGPVARFVDVLDPASDPNYHTGIPGRTMIPEESSIPAYRVHDDVSIERFRLFPVVVRQDGGHRVNLPSVSSWANCDWEAMKAALPTPDSGL